jgi:putative aldouronate transport system permease protein
MNALFIVTGTIVALTLAILLNEIYTSKLTQFYQVTLFLPFFVGSVILGYFAQALFRTDGLINTFFRSLNMETISFYLEPKYWRYIWSGPTCGAGLALAPSFTSLASSASPRVFRSRRDRRGQPSWQQILFITIPMIRYLIVFQVLLAVGKDLLCQLWPVLLCAAAYLNGQLLPVADVIDTFVFRAFQGGYTAAWCFNRQSGHGSSRWFYQSVVGFILIVTRTCWCARSHPSTPCLKMLARFLPVNRQTEQYGHCTTKPMRSGYHAAAARLA